MTTDSEWFEALTRRATEQHDRHLTIMRFTTNHTSRDLILTAPPIRVSTRFWVSLVAAASCFGFGTLDGNNPLSHCAAIALSPSSWQFFCFGRIWNLQNYCIKSPTDQEVRAE